jgi:hypothetical protein
MMVKEVTGLEIEKNHDYALQRPRMIKARTTRDLK